MREKGRVLLAIHPIGWPRPEDSPAESRRILRRVLAVLAKRLDPTHPDQLAVRACRARRRGSTPGAHAVSTLPATARALASGCPPETCWLDHYTIEECGGGPGLCLLLYYLCDGGCWCVEEVPI
ncbi:MAG: hypothetical protein IT458_13065 [Planctomycetes bacterium]|nr:hypothetical protein [Planctomycetota bacterium]